MTSSAARARAWTCAAPGGWPVAAVHAAARHRGRRLAPSSPSGGTPPSWTTSPRRAAALKRHAGRRAVRRRDPRRRAERRRELRRRELHLGAATLDCCCRPEFLKKAAVRAKVFRRPSTTLLYSMQQLFQKVESTKPVASRGIPRRSTCVPGLAPRKVDALCWTRGTSSPKMNPTVAGRAVARQTPAEQERLRGRRLRAVQGAAETFVLCDKPAELLGQYHAFLLDASVRVPETKNAVFWFFFVNAFAARLEADDDQPFSQFVRRNRRVKKHFASFNEASNARVVRDATRRSNARLDSFFDTLFLPCRNSGKKNKKKRRTRRDKNLGT